MMVETRPEVVWGQCEKTRDVFHAHRRCDCGPCVQYQILTYRCELGDDDVQYIILDNGFSMSGHDRATAKRLRKVGLRTSAGAS